MENYTNTLIIKTGKNLTGSFFPLLWLAPFKGTPCRCRRRRENPQGAFLLTAFLAAGSGEYGYSSFGNGAVLVR